MPTIRSEMLIDGGHVACAPLPTLRILRTHAIARCGSNSAIWIALSAAPFRSWSADTNIEIEWPEASLRSFLMRPTRTSSWPDASIGIGK